MGQPGSSVSIVSGYRLDDREIEVRSPAEAKGFSSSLSCPDQLWGVLSPELKRGRGVTHPYSAEVENE
jgi:hypothetical protein